MAIPNVTIDENGIHVPLFVDVLAAVQAEYRSIYGSDIVIDPDQKDGQWLAVIAQAIFDTQAATYAVYQAFSPATAIGAGLSRVVKINGIRKRQATFSTAPVRLIGQNITIDSGIIEDQNGIKWQLPSSILIPVTGEITVTATCSQLGAIRAPIGSINKIASPTAGWQSVSNTSAATPGVAIETDAALRRRQAISTALPSRTVLDGIVGGVAALEGVESVSFYENDERATDVNGIPPNSISLIVKGGDQQDIADLIYTKKSPGVSTYGTTIVSAVDPVSGVPHNIKFFRPENVDISVAITLKPRPGFSSSTKTLIAQTIADWINAVEIGGDIARGDVFLPAKLYGAGVANTYSIETLLIARDGDTPTSDDIVIDINEEPLGDPSYVTITVI